MCKILQNKTGRGLDTSRSLLCSPNPSAPLLRVFLLSHHLLPAAAHPWYGPAWPPFPTPMFPSLQNPSVGHPKGTPSPITVSYLGSCRGGCRVPTVPPCLGTARAPVGSTRPRSILLGEDLQGETGLSGALGEGCAG